MLAARTGSAGRRTRSSGVLQGCFAAGRKIPVGADQNMWRACRCPTSMHARRDHPAGCGYDLQRGRFHRHVGGRVALW